MAVTPAAHGCLGAGVDLCGRHSIEHLGVAARRRTEAGPQRAPKKGRRGETELISVKEVALGLPKKAWRKIKWREGSADWLSSRFARVRVRVGHRHVGPEGRAEEWLLIEWPEGEDEPTKYWLSTLPENIAFRRLVDTRQTALAHRARLSGAQAGGRARPFRRARMARLPPSRHAVHRGLRVPDLREGDNSPLGTSFRPAVPATCRSRRLQTQRIRPCGLSGTSQTPSQQCAYDWLMRSSEACRDVRAAEPG